MNPNERPVIVTISFLFSTTVGDGKVMIELVQEKVREEAERLGLKLVGGSNRWNYVSPESEKSEGEDR